MKRKKMCKVNDNLVTIESTTSEVFFLLTLKQFKLKDSIYSNHEMCCTNDTQRWPHHPRNDHKESTTTET